MQKTVGAGRKEERQTGRGRGGGILLHTPTPTKTPEIGFILNQNKSLSHKSQQLWLNLSRNCDEIYCVRWGKRSGLFLERLWRVGELNTADTCQGFVGGGAIIGKHSGRKNACSQTEAAEWMSGSVLLSSAFVNACTLIG